MLIFRGKVLLVVNVASQCGLTDTNYTQLKEVLDKYKAKGLEIAAFPCNQFNGQEPGCEIDIKVFPHCLLNLNLKYFRNLSTKNTISSLTSMPK